MPPKKLSDDILTACQIIALFLIVIVALINLSLTDRDKALWSTLLGVGFGYLVPNPKLKCIRTNNNDVPIHDNTSEQHFDGRVPRECGVELHDQTKWCWS